MSPLPSPHLSHPSSLAGGYHLLHPKLPRTAFREEGFFYRTETMEYVYMMDGELKLQFDGGDERVIRK